MLDSKSTPNPEPKIPPEDELSDELAPTKSIVNRGKLPDMTALTMQSVSVGTLSLGADAASITTSQQGQRAQYELIEIVGRGGMGEVFSAIQRSLGRVVAVKRLRAVASGESEQDRAMREALFRQEAESSQRSVVRARAWRCCRRGNQRAIRRASPP